MDRTDKRPEPENGDPKVVETARKLTTATAEGIRKATPVVVDTAKKGAHLAMVGGRKGVELATSGAGKAKDLVTSFWKRVSDDGASTDDPRATDESQD